MNVDLFGQDSPGQIIAIDGGEASFVPDDLPPSWKFPVDLWPLLAEARQQLGILEGIGRDLPNSSILLRPLEVREAIGSSKLEGTYATPRELLLFGLDPEVPTTDSVRANEWREVHNYRRALQFGTSSDLPLSLRLMRQLHKTLMTGVRGRDRTPGEFRRVQVAIGVNRRFVPPPVHRMMDCLDKFEKYLHAPSEYDAIVDCFLVHYQFETIHPFHDGNGRVGRLLLAIMLQGASALSRPWLYLSEYFERQRDEYIRLLFEVSTKGNWREWVEFCLKGTVSQTADTIRRCERLKSIRTDFLQRIVTAGGSVRLHQIVETVFDAEFIRVADLPAKLGITYPTAAADIQRLVDVGVLAPLHHLKPKTYFSPEVFDIAYEDMTDG